MRRSRAIKVWFWILAVLAAIVAAIPLVLPPIVESVIVERLHAFDLPARATLSMRYCWRNGPGVKGALIITVRGTPWRVECSYGASCCEWEARLQMREMSISESDFVVGLLLKRFPLKEISDLKFAGAFSVDAKVKRTFAKPMPIWEVRVPISGFDASAKKEDSAMAIEGLSVKLGASGIGDHIDIAPMFLRVAKLSYTNLEITNLTASVRATERALMVNEASADFCGGQIHLYSLFLNMTSLNTGFTLFVENLDAGEVLEHVKGYHGQATGDLHGKIKLRLESGGKTLRLRDAYLYSRPGESGMLQLEDTEALDENLAMSGLDEPTRENVAKALTNLKYDVLKLNLLPRKDKEATLTLRVAGSTASGSTTAPVDITININGEIEQLLNLGLGISDKMKKGKTQ